MTCTIAHESFYEQALVSGKMFEMNVAESHFDESPAPFETLHQEVEAATFPFEVDSTTLKL